MTESEWLGGADPGTMLEFLRGRAGDRKLRLAACACCRRAWRLLADERSRRAVEAAEAFADGQGSPEELAGAEVGALQVSTGPESRPLPGGRYAATAAAMAAGEEMHLLGFGGLVGGALRQANERHPGADADEVRAMAGLLRCVFGNPFRPAPALDPVLLASNERAAVNLARLAYDKRRLPAGTLGPARLQILADALEDAGCTDEQVLGHLRGPGPHVRGCWVLDALLGLG